MSNSVKVAFIISGAIVLASLLLSKWTPLQNVNLNLERVSAINMEVKD